MEAKKTQKTIYLTVEEEILLSRIRQRLLRKGLRFSNSEVVVECLNFYWKEKE